MTVEFKWGKEGSGDPRGGRSEESGGGGGRQKAEGGSQEASEM